MNNFQNMHNNNYQGTQGVAQTCETPRSIGLAAQLSQPCKPPDQSPIHHAAETAYREALALIQQISTIKERIYMTAGCCPPQPDGKSELPIFSNLPEKTSDALRHCNVLLNEIESRIFGK